jgi:protein-arginine kinase activator protein McsA
MIKICQRCKRATLTFYSVKKGNAEQRVCKSCKMSIDAFNEARKACLVIGWIFIIVFCVFIGAALSVWLLR